MDNQEFWQWVEQPENQARQFELVAGALIEAPPPDPLRTFIVVQLLEALYQYVAGRADSSYIFGDAHSYTLAEGVILRPAVALIDEGRLVPRLPYDAAPHLAVELLGSAQPLEACAAKAALYLNHGTDMVWVIEPEGQQAALFRPRRPAGIEMERLAITDALTGGENLSGLSVPIGGLFPPAHQETVNA